MKLTLDKTFPLTLLLVCLLLTVFSKSSRAQKNKIDELIGRYASLHQFNGNVLVAQKGKIIFTKSYGLADMESKVLNTADTRFRIGSITKQFTAMLVMRLRAQGKIDLDSNICTYLPWYRKDIGRRITVQNLLNQNSGLPNYTARDDFYSSLAFSELEPADFAKKYEQADSLIFQPGSKFNYCNTNYYLLGLIAEEAGGKPYGELLRDLIFKPAGMLHSGLDTFAVLLPKRAKGYDYTGDQYINARPINMANSIYAAGAIYSTIADLLQWKKALYSNLLLNDIDRKLFFTPALGNYAMGQYVTKMKSGKMAIGHPGQIIGFSAFLISFPDDDITIIMLDNTTANKRASLDNTASGIYAILTNQPYKLPKVMSH